MGYRATAEPASQGVGSGLRWMLSAQLIYHRWRFSSLQAVWLLLFYAHVVSCRKRTLKYCIARMLPDVRLVMPRRPRGATTEAALQTAVHVWKPQHDSEARRLQGLTDKLSQTRRAAYTQEGRERDFVQLKALVMRECVLACLLLFGVAFRLSYHFGKVCCCRALSVSHRAEMYANPTLSHKHSGTLS